jgi:hypothetical protein
MALEQGTEGALWGHVFPDEAIGALEEIFGELSK